MQGWKIISQERKRNHHNLTSGLLLDYPTSFHTYLLKMEGWACQRRLSFILTTLPHRLTPVKFPTLTCTATILASKSHIRFLSVCLNQGDSGGALVCNGLLAGAASWGSALCEPTFGIPYVYTRISFYYDWIIQQWAWRSLYRMFSSYVLWHTTCSLGFIRKIMSESSILESINEAGYKTKIMCKWKIRRFVPFSRPNKEYINKVQQSVCCSLEQIDFTDH